MQALIAIGAIGLAAAACAVEARAAFRRDRACRRSLLAAAIAVALRVARATGLPLASVSEYKELEPDARRRRHAHRRRALEPARRDHRRREPAGAVPPRAGPEPQRAARAAAAARRLHRRRRPERAHPLRRTARAARLPRLPHVGRCPITCARARGCWCSARAPAPTCCRRSTTRRARVDAVELNPQVVDLVERRFAAFSGRRTARPACASTSPRRAASSRRSRERYDLIEVALLDAFGASAAGLYALSESYLYTVEALYAYLARLEPGGMLAITRWVTLPPRDMLKLFATAVAALERDGVAQPGRQLALIRSWSTATLLVKNGAFTDERDRGAAGVLPRRARSTSTSSPASRPDEANRYNVLDRSWYHDGAIGAARSGARSLRRPLQVRHQPGDRRSPVLLPLLPVAHAARAARAQGPRRTAAARLGLSGADRDADPGDGRRRAADAACRLLFSSRALRRAAIGAV